MAMHTETTASRTVNAELDHGVLVSTIRCKSLLLELAINEIEEQILEALPQAKCALLVDCSELTQHVSSQFLSMLVRVHRTANDAGLKMGICNLSEALRMVYNVTALHSVLPAYDSRQRAIAELGEIDVWDQRPGESTPRAERRDTDATELTTIIRNAAVISLMVTAVAIGLLIAASGQQSDDTSTSVPVRYRAAIAGQIMFVQRDRPLHDAHAMVVAWPVEGRRDKLSVDAFRKAEKEGWIDIRSGVSLVRADRQGRFALPTSSTAGLADYHLLVVSRHSRRHRSVAEHERVLLENCFEDAEKVVAARDFVLTKTQVRADRQATFNWTFAHGRAVD